MDRRRAAVGLEIDAHRGPDREHMFHPRRDPGLARRGTDDLDLVRPRERDGTGAIRHARDRYGHRPDHRVPVLHSPVKQIHVTEELVDERRRGMVVDLLRRTDLLDAALVHDHHPVGHFERFVLVVGDEDAGDVHLVVQAAQPAPQLLAHLGVECAERFVEQQYAGFDRERAGKRDALTLSARQLVRIAVGQPVELYQLEQLVHLAANLRLAGALGARAHPQAEGHVLEDRHVAEQRVVLEHETYLAIAHMAVGGVFAMKQDLPGIDGFEAGDHSQQRGLSAPGGPEQRQQLAGAHLQAHVVERGEIAEAAIHVADIDAHGCGSLSNGTGSGLFCWCSTQALRPRVTMASSASTDAVANAAAN